MIGRYEFILIVLALHGILSAKGAEKDTRSIGSSDFLKEVEKRGSAVRNRRATRYPNLIQSVSFTKSLQTATVKAHNDARSKVSPTATGMLEMSWDNELATLALNYAKECKFAHNPARKHSRFNWVGENIYISERIPFNKYYPERVVKSWDSEKKDYTFRTNYCTPNKMCGHYTQVVWDSSFKVGCGVSKCTSVQVFGRTYRQAYLMVCNYGPGGNIADQRPYKSGIPCSACEDPSDKCKNKLCTNPKRLVPPRSASWMTWSKWTTCSKTCGREGRRTRERMCSTYYMGDCPGATRQIDPFCSYFIKCTSTGVVPSPSVWAPWFDWSKCSKTCGGGTRTRRRRCNYGTQRRPCVGKSSIRGNCNTQKCATPSVWATWTAWSQCSKTCGAGTITRRRSCRLGSARTPCPGSSSENKKCNLQICPTPSVWKTWSPWSKCTKTCGRGTKTRQRTCTLGTARKPCVGSATTSQNCNIQACSTPSVWAPWFDWSKCSKTCGGGTRTRRRRCNYGTQRRPCVGKTSIRGNCNTQKCATPSVWATWTAWSQCSKTCGAGTITRRRSCRLGSARTPCPGSSSENKKCNLQICPIPSVWKTWSPWSKCTKTCGRGTKTRQRTCTLGTARKPCVGSATTSQNCNIQACSIPSVWAPWFDWSKCSKTCGGGTRTRRRQCNFGTERRPCVGKSLIRGNCNTQICPTPSVWAPWFDWSKCSKTCGGGTRTRRRRCNYGTQRKPCVGKNSIRGNCNTQKCPTWGSWQPWSKCSQSCGEGTKSRNRICSSGRNNQCFGRSEEKESCYLNLCSFGWSQWQPWSKCSKTCAGGSRARSRSCLSDPCPGKSTEEENDCNKQPCPEWSKWGSWTSCSTSCGKGIESRFRVCAFGSVQDCTGLPNQNRACDDLTCSIAGNATGANGSIDSENPNIGRRNGSGGNGSNKLFSNLLVIILLYINACLLLF